MSERAEVISVGYRIAHTLNLVLFVLLAITGAVIFSIELFGWLAFAMGAPLATLVGVSDPITGGAQFARALHRLLGHIWGALLIVYLINLVAFGKVRTFDALKRPISIQMREAKALIAHYMAGKPLPEDVRDSMERHNVLVAYLSILLIASFLLLSVSGLAIVYKDAFGLTVADVQLMWLLHDLGFALSLLFVFLHLFATLHPANRPLLNAMFGDGTVPLKWARDHMGAYVRKVLGRGD